MDVERWMGVDGELLQSGKRVPSFLSLFLIFEVQVTVFFFFFRRINLKITYSM